MSEQKYYVKLKNTYKQDEELLSLNKVSGKIDFVDWRNSGAWWIGTKSELGKIMDGAIYKGCVLPDGHEFSSDCKLWINPLIELVPVEDGE